jgi:hypothetical protein
MSQQAQKYGSDPILTDVFVSFLGISAGELLQIQTQRQCSSAVTKTSTTKNNVRSTAREGDESRQKPEFDGKEWVERSVPVMG